MNNQQSYARTGESTTSTGITKSQKILNSVANLHLRTQTRDVPEDLRSAQQLQAELRETWRRPRMPYNKLPDAFQIKHKKKKNNKELLDNLDRIVKINQYKEIQKLLDPITIQKKQEDKPKPQENGNPLSTIHKYFKMESRFREKLQEGDLSLNKYKAFSTKQPQSTVRITDCITLEVIKRGHITGTIKKMLHVPTLKILCVRQQPLNSKEQRVSIKGWLQFWQSKLNNYKNHFLSLQGVFFNVPQGAVSILTDYCENGSLLDLLDSIFTLPECVIREIFLELFESLRKFYEISDQQWSQYGGIAPSQVLFTSEGEVKLSMGLYYQLSYHSSTSIYNLKAQVKQNLFEMNSTQRNFMRQNSSIINTQVDRSMDVFKFGLMMLECAIGGLQNFEQTVIIHQALKFYFTEQGQKALERENVCCILHSENFLLQNHVGEDDRNKRERIDPTRVTPYLKFLKDRFSTLFINFLCCCLKLIHTRRFTLKEILNHSFLINEGYKDTKTVQICLKDLLLINSGWNQQMLQSVHEQQGEKLLNHILHVLNDNRKEVAANLLVNQKQKILNLGKYIGLNHLGLGQKLYDTLLQQARPRRDFNTSI